MSSWGCGYKLCEFSLASDTLAVLYGLLSADWDSRRIALIGEYADERPSNAELESEYSYLETHDLRKTKGLEGLCHLSEWDQSERTARATLPGRVLLVNLSKKAFFGIDTRGLDEFTVAAMMWFIVDASGPEWARPSKDDLVRACSWYEHSREAVDDETLDEHRGTWARDSVRALDGFDPRGPSATEVYRDASEDLRKVADAFRRRANPIDADAPDALDEAPERPPAKSASDDDANPARKRKRA